MRTAYRSMYTIGFLPAAFVVGSYVAVMIAPRTEIGFYIVDGVTIFCVEIFVWFLTGRIGKNKKNE